MAEDRYTKEQRARINELYAERIKQKEEEGFAFYTIPEGEAMVLVRQALEGVSTKTKPIFPPKVEEAN
jgi:hypothetical protein